MPPYDASEPCGRNHEEALNIYCTYRRTHACVASSGSGMSHKSFWVVDERVCHERGLGGPCRGSCTVLLYIHRERDSRNI